MSSGERPRVVGGRNRGKRLKFGRPPLKLSGKRLNRPLTTCHVLNLEQKRPILIDFLTFDSNSTSGFHESDVLKSVRVVQ